MRKTKSSPKLSHDALLKVAGIFALFSEPTRLAILQELKDREMSVNEIVGCLNASQAHISRQLSILHGGGLLHRSRRGTQVFYSIADPIVFVLCEAVCTKLAGDSKKQAALAFGV